MIRMTKRFGGFTVTTYLERSDGGFESDYRFGTLKNLMAGKKMVSIGTMYRESIGLKDMATSIPP